MKKYALIIKERPFNKNKKVFADFEEGNKYLDEQISSGKSKDSFFIEINNKC